MGGQAMTQTKKKEEMLKLDIRIVNCKYTNGDYHVYEVDLLNPQEVLKGDVANFFAGGKTFPTTITGNFDKRMFSGEEYFMYGTYYYHEKYKQEQYKIQFVKVKVDSPDRIREFLLQFSAESIVDQLIEHYGSNVVQNILDDQIDLSLIKGMGYDRFSKLKEKVKENEYLQDLIISLGEYGITPNQMKRIANEWGASAISKINENPYVLCGITGIGFLRSDEIAKRMGFDMSSPFRIREAIKYVIGQVSLEGHTWIERKKMLTEVKILTKLDMKAIDYEIQHTEGIVIVEDNKVALLKVYNAELEVANRLIEIQKNSKELNFNIDKFISEYEEKNGVKLTDQQKSFFHNLKNNAVNYLIGYAGCGKSYILNIANKIFKLLGLSVIFLSPTGKASKVLSEYIGEEAFTIHRAVGWQGTDESYSYLNHEAVVEDESSMADISIMHILLSAVKNENVRIIFVGDDFQIPSVGAGNFLYDCVTSGVFPITKLTKVFRQEDGGALDVITKIRLGEKFLDDKTLGKFKFGNDCIIHCVRQEHMEDGYKYYYNDALKAGYSPDDIIILSPTKKGTLGTNAINKTIQQIVNPPSLSKKEVQYGMETIFREGDRIINIKNTYKVFDVDDVNEEIPLTVVNGDIGVIDEVNATKQCVVINYGFAKIKVLFSGLDLIVHSYALTIHKSQGSGFKYVIAIADKAHTWQLNANLLYTALTRMKQQLRVLCQPNVINSSMKKNISLQRNTFLQNFLKDFSKSS
jgi:exodeoxyribonuclease V alpha subunit